jgi:hypothetical protein
MPAASDTVVDLLRLATAAAQQARTYADLRDGSELLAAAVSEVGVYRLPGFITEMGQRAAMAVVTPAADRRPVQPVATAPGGSPFTPDGRAPDLTPVPLLDDQGNPVETKDEKGNTITVQRPASVDPHFFVEQGAELVLGDESGFGWVGALIEELRKFRIGGQWDTQRLDGRFHREFRDFATIMIGLYGASVGVPEGVTLILQDKYAKWNSQFGDEPMSSIYPHLPERNIWNTRLGYELYRTGRIGQRSVR